MADSDKDKVRQLLVATRFGVSAAEMPMIINLDQQLSLHIIEQLKAEGEDIHSLGEGTNPPELVLYSIGEIEP
ncbi:hypothetical protein JCM19238_4008 [Vibrio ponticus]|nr:hypothetical protein JCM19238_4008 [Vibrio ponticus]